MRINSDPLAVRTEADLAELYGTQMQRKADRIDDQNKLDTSVVKTFMFDTHIEGAKADSHNATLSYVSNVAEKLHCKIVPLNEANFFRLERKEGDRTNYFFLNGKRGYNRFWLLHTDAQLGSANSMHRTLTRLTGIDSAWLPKQLLKSIERGELPRGFTPGFDDITVVQDLLRKSTPEQAEQLVAQLIGVDLITGELVAESGTQERIKSTSLIIERENAVLPELTIRVWGDASLSCLQMLDEHAQPEDPDYPNLPPRITTILNFLDSLQRYVPLTRVRLRNSLDATGRSGGSVTNNINYVGRTVTSDRSFLNHLDFMDVVLKRYRHSVNWIERHLVYSYDVKGGFSGEPTIITFNPNSSYSLNQVVQRIFNSNYPFRLWGLPVERSATYVRVHAVDLHVGHDFTFEITPSSVKIELPRGICGNTLNRFLSLFQQHYNTTAHIDKYDKELYGATL